MRKQFRLGVYWLFYTLQIALLTYVFAFLKTRDDDGVLADVVAYVTCVMLTGGTKHCDLEIDNPNSGLLVTLWVLIAFFPTISFFVFSRVDLIYFWKEYFAHCIKHKTLVLSFVPSFDPQIRNISTSKVTVRTLDEIEQEANDNNNNNNIDIKETIAKL